MNRAQTLAWFCLRVFAIAGSLCLLAGIISFLSSEPVFAYIGLFILAAGSLVMNISPVLIRKETGAIAFDERDKMIERNTHLIGYCILWCFFIVTCMVVHVIIGPIILVTALVTIKLVESIATLAQYGRGETENEYHTKRRMG
jgi:hypothetical protein